MNWTSLRVGLIGPLPPPAGGMANQTRQLKELLEREGAQVVLVQTNAPYRPSFVGHVLGVRALFRLFPYLVALWRCTATVDVLHVMANSGWSWHLFAAPAIWIGRMRRRGIVVNYRGGEASEFLERSAHLVLPTLSRSNVLAVPSIFLRDVFARFGVQADILPNIVDLSRFQPAATGVRSDNELRILVARNLESIYDVETAIRAFKTVSERQPGARLVIAGTGPERERLGALASKLGVASKVTFTGRLDRDQMAEAYREASVALNPSRADNMPNSLLEALASGVPVVSTRVGGVPHMVVDGVSALLVPPADPEAMASALLRVIVDADLAARLRAAGLAEVVKYTWPSIRGGLLALYQTAVGSQDKMHARAI